MSLWTTKERIFKFTGISVEINRNALYSKMSWLGDPAAFAGFFDGDGCAEITRGLTLRLRIKQAGHNIANLHDLVDVCGSICKNRSESLEKAEAYDWGVYGQEAVRVAGQLVRHSLLSSKREQLRIIADWNVPCDLEGPALVAHRHRLAQRVKELKKTDDEPVDPESVTDAYVGGFFTAEGCASVKGHAPWASIGQKNTAILHAIRARLGYGRVHGCDIEFFGEDAVAFLRRIRPHVGPGKLPQVDLVLGLTRDNKVETVARLRELKGRPGVALRQHAQGSVRVYAKDGVELGYVARLRDHWRTFTDRRLTMEQKRALAEAKLEEFRALPADEVSVPRKRKVREEPAGPRKNAPRPVLCYPVHGSEQAAGPPMLFPSLAAASAHFEKGGEAVPAGNIHKVLTGKMRRVKSYAFRYFVTQEEAT